MTRVNEIVTKKVKVAEGLLVKSQLGYFVYLSVSDVLLLAVNLFMGLLLPTAFFSPLRLR